MAVTEAGTPGRRPDEKFRSDAMGDAWSRGECLASECVLASERVLADGGSYAEEVHDRLVRRFEATNASSVDGLAPVRDGFVDFGGQGAVLDNLERKDQQDARHGCPAADVNEGRILADVPYWVHNYPEGGNWWDRERKVAASCLLHTRPSQERVTSVCNPCALSGGSTIAANWNAPRSMSSVDPDLLRCCCYHFLLLCLRL